MPYLNPFQTKELKVLVVESAEGLKLLQERDEHARVVLVRTWQVDVFQVEHQPLAVTRPVDPAVGSAEQTTRLGHLLACYMWVQNTPVS